MKLIMIRHGQTQGNMEGRYLGRTDEPLCPEGAGYIKKKKEKPKEVLVRNGNRTRSVSADDIYYIESSNRKVTLYLRHEKIEYYDKISSLESELKPDFFRIHKGYLVNIKYVERYDRTEVKMRNGDSLLISKYKYQDFVKRYLEYISEER